mgnify:FL=1
MENKSTHESILTTKDGVATPRQVNYLIALYKETLKSSILKSHKKIDIKNDWVNFGGRGELKGKFAIHMYNSFIPANKEFTKNKVSGLIHNAKTLGKFDKTFAKSLVKSVNAYVK